MGKTVTTYLVDSDPNGTQYAFISNKICQVFVIPRSNLAYLNKQEKLQKPAFYILLGEGDSSKPQAYIGETENFKERVKDHDSKKTFWQKALVFVSKDADMTKSDVQYLEFRGIAEAKEAAIFELNENKQIPKCPNLPEFQQDTMDEFFDDIKFLASFVGCNIFDKVDTKEEHLFYVTGRGSNAMGFYNVKGFTVLKDSVIASDEVASFTAKSKRKEFIHEWTIPFENKFKLTSNYTFSSPSTASSFCMGRPSNGWVDWKDEESQTLETIYKDKLK